MRRKNSKGFGSVEQRIAWLRHHEVTISQLDAHLRAPDLTKVDGIILQLLRIKALAEQYKVETNHPGIPWTSVYMPDSCQQLKLDNAKQLLQLINNGKHYVIPARQTLQITHYVDANHFGPYTLHPQRLIRRPVYPNANFWTPDHWHQLRKHVNNKYNQCYTRSTLSDLLVDNAADCGKTIRLRHDTIEDLIATLSACQSIAWSIYVNDDCHQLLEAGASTSVSPVSEEPEQELVVVDVDVDVDVEVEVIYDNLRPIKLGGEPDHTHATTSSTSDPFVQSLPSSSSSSSSSSVLLTVIEYNQQSF